MIHLRETKQSFAALKIINRFVEPKCETEKVNVSNTENEDDHHFYQGFPVCSFLPRK